MNALSDEDQLDNLKSFTKKYGSAIISGILIALIAFFGWEYWQKKTLAENQMRTAKVQQLMDEARNVNSQDINALNALSQSADKIVKEAPDSVHALQAQFVMAKQAYDRGDYAAAEKALKRVEATKLKDEGLVHVLKLRLAYAQLAQNKYDAALKTLADVTDPAFKATAEEARGDVYVAKMILPQQKKLIRAHGMHLLSVKKNDKFYKLNSKV